MKFNQVVIDSYAYYSPEYMISSSEIEQRLIKTYQRLNLPEGRLELMTGIQTRGYWQVGTPPSRIATKAAENVFNKSNIKKEEIDLLINASVCRDFLEPSTASVVHHNLKLSKNCMLFDLSNACLGFLNAILIASQFIEAGNIKNALIVSGENSGPLLESTIEELLSNQSISRKDIKKYIANLTIGSIGTAMILTKKDQNISKPEIIGGVFKSETDANHLCRGDGNPDKLFMQTDSEELLKYGIELGVQTYGDFLKELEIQNENINLVLTHQVGSAHEKLSLDSFKLNNHKTYRTYPSLGNTGSGALPVTLMKAEEDRVIQKDDLVAMLGIGSGLVSIMLGVKWK